MSKRDSAVRLSLKVTPKASRNQVQGLAPEADGSTVLKLQVTAPPENGKANAAVIKLLAKEWGFAKSAIELISGETDRRKVIDLKGEPESLCATLTAWLEKRKKA